MCGNSGYGCGGGVPTDRRTHARAKTSNRPPGTIKIDDAQAEADDDDDDDDDDEEER